MGNCVSGSEKPENKSVRWLSEQGRTHTLHITHYILASYTYESKSIERVRKCRHTQYTNSGLYILYVLVSGVCPVGVDCVVLCVFCVCFVCVVSMFRRALTWSAPLGTCSAILQQYSTVLQWIDVCWLWIIFGQGSLLAAQCVGAPTLPQSVDVWVGVGAGIHRPRD